MKNACRILQEGQDEILVRWMKLVLEQVSAAQEIRKYQLKNSIPNLLKSLCFLLDETNNEKPEDSNIDEHAKEHGTREKAWAITP